jgi:hypothetical protein
MQYRLKRKLHLDNISYYYYVQMVNYKERIFDNESIINFMKIREKNRKGRKEN